MFKSKMAVLVGMGWLALPTIVMATTVTFEVPSQANLYQQTNPETEFGSIDPVKVPKIRLSPGQSIEVTATGCAVSNGPICVSPDGYPELFRELPVYSLIGRWSHSPDILDNSTVASEPFYVGSFSILSVPSEPGDYYLFLGENDGNFSDNAESITVTATTTLIRNITISKAWITPTKVKQNEYINIFAQISGDPNKIGQVVFMLNNTERATLTDPDGDGTWSGQYQVIENLGYNANTKIVVKNAAGGILARWPGFSVTK